MEVEFYRGLVPGKRALLFYSDDTVWHEALIALIVSDEDAVIYTPDGDLYVETLSCKGVVGPVKLRGLISGNRLPSGLGASAYRFKQKISDELLRKVFRDAMSLAESDGYDVVQPDYVIDAKGALVSFDDLFGGRFLRRRVEKVAPEVDAKSVVAPHHVKTVTHAPADHVWLAAEPLGGLVLGQEVSLSSDTDIQIGDRCAMALRQGVWVKIELVRQVDAPHYGSLRRELFQGIKSAVSVSGEAAKGDPGRTPKIAGEEADDDKEVRTLWVDFDEHGDRFKRWRDVCQESFTPTFAQTPLEGPSTALHILKHTERHGGDPRLWLQLWLRSKHIEQSDRTYHEMRVLVDALYYAGTYDQVNIPSLICMEVVCRRLQAIVDAYSNPSRPSWENAKIYAGQGGPDDIISPSFRTYAAKRNKDELELLQARQKVRELRNSPLTQVDEGDGSEALPKPPKPAPKKRGGKGGQQQGDGQ